MPVGVLRVTQKEYFIALELAYNGPQKDRAVFRQLCRYYRNQSCGRVDAEQALTYIREMVPA